MDTTKSAEVVVASVQAGQDSITIICDEIVGRMRHDKDMVRNTRARRIAVVSLVMPYPPRHELLPAALLVCTRDFTLELVG